MNSLISFLVDGTVYASVLALITVSFSLTYQAIGFVNFAHVGFVTVGAMLAVTLADFMPMAVALVLAACLTGIFATALDLLIFRRMQRVFTETRMIASAGVGIMIAAGVQYFWGLAPRFFEQSSSGLTVSGVTIRYQQMAVIGTVALVLGAFWILMKRTSLGRLFRATADAPDLVEARGISGSRVVSGVWFASGALAALGGALLGVDTVVATTMGDNVLIPIFAAAVLGGLGSTGGAIVGALLLSFGQRALLLADFGAIFSGGTWHIPSQYGSVLVFALMILVLVFKPQGILAPFKERA